MVSIESAQAVFPFLARLTVEQRRVFEHSAQQVRLDPGAHICLEGELCQGLPLVLSGEARVYRTSSSGRALTLYRIEPGESCILTASCLLSGLPFPAFAEAETQVEALLVPARAFTEAFQAIEPWREHIFELLARRLASVIELVDAVAFQRVDERLASHLVDQVDAEGRVARTHEMLAEALGTSREVVSRALKEFERRGLVTLTRGEVTLTDVNGLRRYG
ncbi:MAG: Crp/Fnr family transcriptional regulator [Rubricoccaceae bacterium]